MIGALFRKEMKSNWILLVIFLAVLSVYGGMITMMFDPKLGDSLRAMSESMPDLFAAFGMINVGTTLLEFVSGYLYGILFVAFPGVFIIILTNRLCARYVDHGSMAYLLASPVKRWKIVFTQAVFLFLCLLIMVGFATGMILVLSGLLYPGEMDVNAFLRLNTGLLGLLVFFGGANFCASCLCNESKISSAVSTAVVVYSLLLQMISRVGDKFEYLKYATPLTLFDVNGLCAGEAAAWAGCAVLYGVGILLTVIGIAGFSRRDLPL